MRQVEEVWEENSHKGEVSKEGSRKRRVGYLGHLYRIAGNIQDVVVNKENKKYFEEWLESQDNPLFWNTFYEETLKVGFCVIKQLMYSRRCRSMF